MKNFLRYFFYIPKLETRNNNPKISETIPTLKISSPKSLFIKTDNPSKQIPTIIIKKPISTANSKFIISSSRG